MLQRLKEARRNESGFTLIELLIVIVILGVLAGIAVFGVAAFNNQSVAAACKADVSNVQTASEAFYANGNGGAGGGSYAASIQALVDAGYLKNLPGNGGGKYTITYDPATGNVTGNC